VAETTSGSDRGEGLGLGIDWGIGGGDEQRRLAALRRYEILDTPPDGAFDRVAALAARWLQAPIATVTLVDEDRIWFKACHGLAGVREVPREPGLCASAVLSDEAYVVTDARTDTRTLNNSLVRGELGLQFYAAAPLVTHDGYRLGTINVIDHEPRKISDDEIATLRDLAAVVVDEIEVRRAALTSVRTERQLREQAQRDKQRVEKVARTLTQTLVPPRLPHVPGLQVASHYRPASPDNLGGDFYDLFPVADGCWGLLIGDVCGKDVEAASLTSLARHTLRAAALVDRDPALALADLDTMIRLDRSEGDPVQFCTAIYAEMQQLTDGVRLTLANGGHPPAYLLHHTGGIETVRRTGPLIGCLPDAEFSTVTVTLAPGDTVLFCTDGLPDARLDGHRLGEEGLRAHLAGRGPLPATALIDELRTLIKSSDAILRDDIALLAISVPAR
jgi:sigma-B regulation protein RsbU (phosphoserine phosphatase)